MQVRTQVLNRDRALLRFDERGLARGLVIRQERGHERPPFPVLERLLLRTQERGPHRGQELPQPSGG